MKIEMDNEHFYIQRFYLQLGKTIQAWLRVESELYSLYSTLMGNANSHLVSVTFYHIESFKSKLKLVKRCLKLFFDPSSENYKNGNKLLNKSEKLNEKRNVIVHNQVVISKHVSELKSIDIRPSAFNALALVKNYTTHKGPVITKGYKPSNAKLKNEYKIDYLQLIKLEKSFKSFSRELDKYTKSIKLLIKEAHKKNIPKIETANS